MKTRHHYQTGDLVTTVSVQPEGDGFVVTVGDRVYRVAAQVLASGQLSMKLDGQQIQAHVLTQQGEQHVALAGKVWRLQPGISRRPQVAPPERVSGRVEAAMPGVIGVVLVNVGDIVSQGQPLLLLTAMKMELRLAAPCAGQIGQVNCQPGQIVEQGTLLLEITCQT